MQASISIKEDRLWLYAVRPDPFASCNGWQTDWEKRLLAEASRALPAGPAAHRPAA